MTKGSIMMLLIQTSSQVNNRHPSFSSTQKIIKSQVLHNFSKICRFLCFWEISPTGCLPTPSGTSPVSRWLPYLVFDPTFAWYSPRILGMPISLGFCLLGRCVGLGGACFLYCLSSANLWLRFLSRELGGGSKTKSMFVVLLGMWVVVVCDAMCVVMQVVSACLLCCS